ncbi:hypothetical protein ABC761_04140 [Salmonella sp. ZASA478]
MSRFSQQFVRDEYLQQAAQRRICQRAVADIHHVTLQRCKLIGKRNITPGR